MKFYLFRAKFRFFHVFLYQTLVSEVLSFRGKFWGVLAPEFTKKRTKNTLPYLGFFKDDSKFWFHFNPLPLPISFRKFYLLAVALIEKFWPAWPCDQRDLRIATLTKWSSPATPANKIRHLHLLEESRLLLLRLLVSTPCPKNRA